MDTPAAPAAPAPAAPGQPSAKLVRVASIALVAMAGVFLFEAALARYQLLPRLVKGSYFVVGVVLLAGLRLPRSARVSAVITLLPVVVGIFAVSAVLEAGQPRDGTVAASHGREFDTRTRSEVIDGFHSQGAEAYPSVGLKALMRGAEIGRRVSGPEALMPHIEGVLTAPLGGIANVTTVLCNESGTYAIYESDEHGFSNPRGTWQSPTLDLAALGDSFTQGACVPAERSIPALLRERYPATLNLGISGDGPLAELATLTEYLPPFRPKIVLWFYFDNDLPDLSVEKTSPLLMRYLEEGFTQGLLAKQGPIDAAIKKTVRPMLLHSRGWPASLDKMGLSRAGSPHWLQDLVMNEHHSSAAAVLRLDRIGAALEAQSTPAPAVPDLPLFQTILEKARDRVAAWGGELRFIYLPDLPYLLGRPGLKEHPLRKGVLDAVSAAHLPLLDLHPVFAALPSIKDVMWHAESHLNEEGYKIVTARVLADLDRKP
ncbi:MAG: SGNH/GDSL hydrolase family protein [Byssovorax sp.]